MLKGLEGWRQRDIEILELKECVYFREVAMITFHKTSIKVNGAGDRARHIRRIQNWKGLSSLQALKQSGCVPYGKAAL